jgi:hypothetical protein
MSNANEEIKSKGTEMEPWQEVPTDFQASRHIMSNFD